jgi:hypothetical protein
MLFVSMSSDVGSANGSKSDHLTDLDVPLLSSIIAFDGPSIEYETFSRNVYTAV